MTLRKLAITTLLLLAVVLVLGCGDDAPPQMPGMQPPLPVPVPAPMPVPPPIPAATAQAPELNPVEQQTLKAQYTAEAAVEITDDNAAAAAAALEQEIDAELAAEQ